MNVTVSREQGYWRAKCDNRATCASFTAAGNVAAYWRGPHRSNRADAHADAVMHAAVHYGQEDGRADALAGREPAISPGADEYSIAYLAAYDAALAETCPDNIRPVA